MKVSIYKKSVTQSGFGETENEVKQCDINIDLYVKSIAQQQQNNIDALMYDYIGLTDDPFNFEKGMYFPVGSTIYRIEYIIPSKRKTQLFLKVVL